MGGAPLFSILILKVLWPSIEACSLMRNIAFGCPWPLHFEISRRPKFLLVRRHPILLLIVNIHSLIFEQYPLRSPRHPFSSLSNMTRAMPARRTRSANGDQKKSGHSQHVPDQGSALPFQQPTTSTKPQKPQKPQKGKEASATTSVAAVSVLPASSGEPPLVDSFQPSPDE